MSLDQGCNLIEQCHFQNALGNREAARAKILEAAKILRQLEAPEIHRACVAAFDAIGKPRDPLLWLNSHVDGHFFPPLLSKGFRNRPTDSLESDSLALPDYDVSMETVHFESWSTAELSSLYQDLLTNCLFVSSVLSIVRNSGVSLVDLVWPHLPAPNYLVVLHFNGCERIVRVDNKLPVMRNGRSLTVLCGDNQKLLWPALIEKAFLKVMSSGYNFPGSHMAIDTFTLLGWIPEVIQLKDGLPSNFSDLMRRCVAGDITLGVGTGQMLADLAQRLGLVLHHDYVIREYKEEGGEVTLQNPWRSHQHLVTLSEFSTALLSTIYVNWSPARFSHHKKVHFVSPKEVCSLEWYKRSQFTFTGPAWLLLEEHLPSKNEVVHLTVLDSQYKVLAPHQYEVVDEASGLRFVLVKVEATKTLTVVVGASNLTGFTLHAYLDQEANLSKASTSYKLLPPIFEDWAACGGHWALTLFLNNPQFQLQIGCTSLFVMLIADDHDIEINFHLFFSDSDKPLRNFDKSKLLFNNHYTAGSHFHEITDLKPGPYRLILLTYTPNYSGKYKLAVFGDGRVSMMPVPVSLGLFHRTHNFTWENENRYKLHFVVEAYATEVTFHIKHRGAESITDYIPPMRASIFHSSQSPILINETWNDCPYGIFVDCTLEPGAYILLVERFEAGIGECIVSMGSNRKIQCA